MGCGNRKEKHRQIAYQRDFLGTCWDSTQTDVDYANDYIPSHWMGMSAITMEKNTGNLCFTTRTLLTRREATTAGAVDSAEVGASVAGGGAGSNSASPTTVGAGVMNPAPLSSVNESPQLHGPSQTFGPPRVGGNSGGGFARQTSAESIRRYISPHACGSGALPSVRGRETLSSSGHHRTHLHGGNHIPERARSNSDTHSNPAATLRTVMRDTREQEKAAHNNHPYLRINGLSVLPGVIFTVAPAKRRYEMISLIPNDASDIASIKKRDDGDEVGDAAATAAGQEQGSASSSKPIIQILPNTIGGRQIPRRTSTASSLALDLRSEPTDQLSQQQPSSSRTPLQPRATSCPELAVPETDTHLEDLQKDPLSKENNYPLLDRDDPHINATTAPVIIGSIAAHELLALGGDGNGGNVDVCFGGWLYISLQDEHQRLRRCLDDHMKRREERLRKLAEKRAHRRRRESHHHHHHVGSGMHSGESAGRSTPATATSPQRFARPHRRTSVSSIDSTLLEKSCSRTHVPYGDGDEDQVVDDEITSGLRDGRLARKGSSGIPTPQRYSSGVPSPALGYSKSAGMYEPKKKFSFRRSGLRGEDVRNGMKVGEEGRASSGGGGGSGEPLCFSKSYSGAENRRRVSRGDGGTSALTAEEESEPATWIPYAYVIVAAPMYECTMLPTAHGLDFYRSKPISLNVSDPISRKMFGVGSISSIRYGGMTVIECRDTATATEDDDWVVYLHSLAKRCSPPPKEDDETAAAANGRKGKCDAEEGAAAMNENTTSTSTMSTSHFFQAKNATMCFAEKNQHDSPPPADAAVLAAMSADEVHNLLSRVQSQVSKVHDIKKQLRKALMQKAKLYVVMAFTRVAARRRREWLRTIAAELAKDTTMDKYNGKDLMADLEKLDFAFSDIVAQRSTFMLSGNPKELHIRGTFRQIGGLKYLDANALMDGCPLSDVVTAVMRWVVNLLYMPIKARPLSLYLQRHEGIAQVLRLVPNRVAQEVLDHAASEEVPAANTVLQNASFVMQQQQSYSPRALVHTSSPNVQRQIGSFSSAPQGTLPSGSFGSIGGVSHDGGAAITSPLTRMAPTTRLLFHTYYTGPLDPDVKPVLPKELEAMLDNYLRPLKKDGTADRADGAMSKSASAEKPDTTHHTENVCTSLYSARCGVSVGANSSAIVVAKDDDVAPPPSISGTATHADPHSPFIEPTNSNDSKSHASSAGECHDVQTQQQQQFINGQQSDATAPAPTIENLLLCNTKDAQRTVETIEARFASNSSHNASMVNPNSFAVHNALQHVYRPYAANTTVAAGTIVAAAAAAYSRNAGESLSNSPNTMMTTNEQLKLPEGGGGEGGQQIVNDSSMHGSLGMHLERRMISASGSPSNPLTAGTGSHYWFPSSPPGTVPAVVSNAEPDAYSKADRELRALKSELEEMQFLVSNAQAELLAQTREYISLSSLFLPHTRADQAPLSLLFMKMLHQFPNDVPVKELGSEWLPMLMSLITTSRDQALHVPRAGEGEGSVVVVVTTTGQRQSSYAQPQTDMCDANKEERATALMPWRNNASSTHPFFHEGIDEGCEEGGGGGGHKKEKEEEGEEKGGPGSYMLTSRRLPPPTGYVQELAIAPPRHHLHLDIATALERSGVDSGLSFCFTGGSLGLLAGVLRFYADTIKERYTAATMKTAGTSSGRTSTEVLAREHNVFLRRIFLWGATEGRHHRRSNGGEGTRQGASLFNAGGCCGGGSTGSRDVAWKSSGARGSGSHPRRRITYEDVKHLEDESGVYCVTDIGIPFMDSEAFALFDAAVYYLQTFTELELEDPETHAAARPVKRRSILYPLLKTRKQEEEEAAAAAETAAAARARNSDRLVTHFDLCIATNQYYKHFMTEAVEAPQHYKSSWQKQQRQHRTRGVATAAATTASKEKGNDGGIIAESTSVCAQEPRALNGSFATVISNIDSDDAAMEARMATRNGKGKRRKQKKNGVDAAAVVTGNHMQDSEKPIPRAAAEHPYCGGDEDKSILWQKRQSQAFYGFLKARFDQWLVMRAGDKVAAHYGTHISVSIA